MVELGAPRAADVRRVVEERLGRHEENLSHLDAIADRSTGLPIGRVRQVCDDAIKCALWKHPEAPLVEERHVEAAITRIREKPTYEEKLGSNIKNRLTEDR